MPSRYTLAILAALLASTAVADVTIKLRNGRSIEVPVDCSEIETISFSAAMTSGGGSNTHPRPPTSDASGQDQPKPAAYGLNIVSATYGQPGQMCNAREQVAAQCQGKGFCQIYVANHTLCGDPAYGKEKRLVVDLQCKDARETKTFPEGAQLLLRCPN